jgi:hypothetical protein
VPAPVSRTDAARPLNHGLELAGPLYNLVLCERETRPLAHGGGQGRMRSMEEQNAVVRLPTVDPSAPVLGREVTEMLECPRGH